MRFPKRSQLDLKGLVGKGCQLAETLVPVRLHAGPDFGRARAISLDMNRLLNHLHSFFLFLVIGRV